MAQRYPCVCPPESLIIPSVALAAALALDPGPVESSSTGTNRQAVPTTRRMYFRRSARVHFVGGVFVGDAADIARMPIVTTKVLELGGCPKTSLGKNARREWT